MESYEEILGRMRRTYTEKSGQAPDEVSDIGLRLQVLAGELYRLQAGVEWLKRQAFPQTADGPQLDLHGAQRGVKRKGGTRAVGNLSFSRYVPISFDLVIPKGTVCASYGGEAVEYETTEDGILLAGQVTVEIPAQAVESGSKGNAAASYINTLVTEVNGVNYVVNTAPFTGGADPEADESYRGRVLEEYKRMGHTGSAGWYEALALEEPGIADAQAVLREDGAGTVSVYVWGEGAAPDAEAIAALQEKLSALSEAGVTVTVKAATEKKVGVMAFIMVKPGTVFSEARQRVLDAMPVWFAQRKIGDAVYFSDLNRVILDADPAISKVTFNSASKELAAAAGVRPGLAGVMISEG